MVVCDSKGLFRDLYCQGRQATMTIPHAFPEAYNFGSELGNYISINVIKEIARAIGEFKPPWVKFILYTP